MPKDHPDYDPHKSMDFDPLKGPGGGAGGLRKVKKEAEEKVRYRRKCQIKGVLFQIYIFFHFGIRDIMGVDCFLFVGRTLVY